MFMYDVPKTPIWFHSILLLSKYQVSMENCNGRFLGLIPCHENCASFKCI